MTLLLDDPSAGHNRNRGTIETENYHFILSTGTDQPFAIHNSFTLTAISSMADLIDAHDQDELPGYFLGIDFLVSRRNSGWSIEFEVE